MHFQLIENKEQWNQFVAGQKYAQFLQSWEWGEFQKFYGRRVWRVGFFEDFKRHSESDGRLPADRQEESLIGVAQIVEHYLGLGYAYFYIPRGPFMAEPSKEAVSEFVEFIKKKIANYGTLFVKIEWQHAPNLEGQKNLIRVKAVQPACTMFIDLQKTENELLSKMHEKTRYNIRLAYKKNLDVKITAKNFSEEWHLLKETSRRDKISLHSQNYYQLMDKALAERENFVYKKIFVFQGHSPLAMGVFIGFGDTFSYVHGASSNKHRELMAPYLLQWEAIKYAKTQSFKFYDFGGVNPKDKADFEYHPKWEGISRFKHGFGGEIFSCGSAFDAVLNERGYKLYGILKKAWRLI